MARWMLRRMVISTTMVILTLVGTSLRSLASDQAACLPNQVPCGSACIPSGWQCCNESIACFAQPGVVCKCDSSRGNACAANQIACGSACIPSGWQCCDESDVLLRSTGSHV